jgi:hypothetical protein
MVAFAGNESPGQEPGATGSPPPSSALRTSVATLATENKPPAAADDRILVVGADELYGFT